MGMTATRWGVWLVTLLPVIAGVATAALQEEREVVMQEMEELAKPGAEHAALATLVGSWQVSARSLMSGGGADDVSAGQGVARTRLGGRFLEVELVLEGGLIREAWFVLGYDRRHETYTVSYMDDTGTYGVAAAGERDGDEIVMLGTDDDPVMTAMGMVKEFAIVLHHDGDTEGAPTEAAIEIRFIDNRTEERTHMPFYMFELTR